MLWLSVGRVQSIWSHPPLFLSGWVHQVTNCLLVCAVEQRRDGRGGVLSGEFESGAPNIVFPSLLCVLKQKINHHHPPTHTLFFQLTEGKKQLKGFTHVCLKQTFNERPPWPWSLIYIINDLIWLCWRSSGSHSLLYWYVLIISGDGRSQAH